MAGSWRRALCAMTGMTTRSRTNLPQGPAALRPPARAPGGIRRIPGSFRTAKLPGETAGHVPVAHRHASVEGARPGRPVQQVAPEERAIRTRQRIIQAAASVFDENGYLGAATSTIVNTGDGLTPGAMHFHFPSKREPWR